MAAGLGHKRGRPRRPKKRVLCPRCGWKGVRGTLGKKCPACYYWHPQEVKDDSK